MKPGIHLVKELDQGHISNPRRKHSSNDHWPFKVMLGWQLALTLQCMNTDLTKQDQKIGWYKILKNREITKNIELHLSKSPLPGWGRIGPILAKVICLNAGLRFLYVLYFFKKNWAGNVRERSRPLPAYHLRSIGCAFWPVPAYLEFLNTCIKIISMRLAKVGSAPDLCQDGAVDFFS